ncbi:hypothetical protein ZOD2009_06192 [Haladaptatus paucihalophilus DX253]|uniref:DUF8135 domain-containing protein n=1 Tax=Haladaptatus paucihalophilus DX253 TaxID=797209 RepID=E7QR18_HALPU|nr:hypothetical protein [Haladaptatus paucihalophilus]EFW93432.1 hypothetical protein ZOD2009_06192 [Haladaptatus paucihalophilus DX253]SHK54560.1 hypothetical protein SAMN05444342_1622 [Haladaptatus paucihalophilus DX253]
MSDRPPEDDRDEPLADLAADIEERRKRKSTSVDDAFREENVGDIDTDELWADLLREDSGELVVSAPREAGRDDRDVRTIPKATCHGCPHVGDPPSLHCTHEGTDILSMPDTDHFRVADCPMVADEDNLDTGSG